MRPLKTKYIRMNKNKITIIIVLVLSAVAAYLLYNNKTGTIKKELKDFAVKDTANVSKIFMATGNGKTVTLERQNGGHWIVNGKFEARKDGIELVLSTISNLEVKSPVSRSSFNKIVSNLAGNSIKVEIYKGEDEPAKVFYVGGATQDNLGTYMLLENSSVPFIMHIPGFNGYLTSRFFMDEAEWKATTLYRYNPKEIEKIEINYLENPKESFIIDHISSGKPRLKSIYLDKYLDNFDTFSVLDYVNNFKKVNFEFFSTDLSEASRDSIITHCKKFTIEITDIKGRRNLFTAFNKPMKNEGAMDLEGNPIVFDADRMYGLTQNNDFVVIQYFVFGDLTPSLNYFLKIVKK